MQRLLVVGLPRALPAQALAWPVVQVIIRRRDVRVADGGQVRALREVLPEQPVGVLVGAPLPGVVRQAEVDGGADRLLQRRGRRELRAPVQRDRPHDLARERALRCLVDRGAAPGGGPAAHQVARLPVDLRDQAGAAGPADDRVALPVAHARAVGRLGRALAELVGGPDLAPGVAGPLGVAALPAVPEPPAHSLPARQLAVQVPVVDGAVDGAGANGVGGALHACV